MNYAFPILLMQLTTDFLNSVYAQTDADLSINSFNKIPFKTKINRLRNENIYIKNFLIFSLFFFTKIRVKTVIKIK